MLPILIGVAFGLLLLFVAFCFVCWAAREHHFANKYRAAEIPGPQLVTSVPAVVAGPDQWILTYKDKKGKHATMNLVGKDESEMLRNAVKAGVSFDKIVSTRRA